MKNYSFTDTILCKGEAIRSVQTFEQRNKKEHEVLTKVITENLMDLMWN